MLAPRMNDRSPSVTALLLAARRAFERAVALNPSYATARQGYGQFLSLRGHFEAGVAELEQARELDPLSRAIAMDLGSAYLFARRYEEAVTHYQNVLVTAPRFAVAYVFLGMAYEQQGRYDAAVAAQQRAIDLGGRNPL